MNDTIEQKVNHRLKMLEEQLKLMREDINRILDGTDEEPGISKKLDKLDKLDEIVELLKNTLENNRL